MPEHRHKVADPSVLADLVLRPSVCRVVERRDRAQREDGAPLELRRAARQQPHEHRNAARRRQRAAVCGRELRARFRVAQLHDPAHGLELGLVVLDRVERRDEHVRVDLAAGGLCGAAAAPDVDAFVELAQLLAVGGTWADERGPLQTQADISQRRAPGEQVVAGVAGSLTEGAVEGRRRSLPPASVTPIASRDQPRCAAVLGRRLWLAVPGRRRPLPPRMMSMLATTKQVRSCSR